MDDIEIESDVPLMASHKNGRPASYPWREMQVGDSILIPAERTHPKHASKRAYAASKRTGYKFTCRTQEDGVRVWRIA